MALKYSSEKPDLEILRNIAVDVVKVFDCRQLAIRLGKDDDIVTQELERTKDPKEIAYSVLKMWWKSENASCSNLYHALDCDPPFKHLAIKFKERLLNKSEMDKPLRAKVALSQVQDKKPENQPTIGTVQAFKSDKAENSESFPTSPKKMETITAQRKRTSDRRDSAPLDGMPLKRTRRAQTSTRAKEPYKNSDIRQYFPTVGKTLPKND